MTRNEEENIALESGNSLLFSTICYKNDISLVSLCQTLYDRPHSVNCDYKGFTWWYLANGVDDGVIRKTS